MRQTPYLLGPLIIVMVVWLPLFVERVRAHQPNSDDYGYAIVARRIAQSGNFLHAILATGKNAPLVPTLAAPGYLIGGFYGAMALELPILLMVVAGAFVLARTWLSPRASMATSLVVGLCGAVLGYSLMLNFALAATAAALWCFAAYLRSDRLTNLVWSVVFGVAMSSLLLARSIAPVYVIPLVVVVITDLVVGVRRDGIHVGRPAVTALAVIVILALPWWLVSGPSAVHYLLSAGYQSSSGFAKHGVALTPSGVVVRTSWELATLGWFEAVGLSIGVAAAAVVAAFRWRTLRTTHLWLVAGWAVATMLILSTSTNHGTAFGLPVLVTVIVLCGAILGQQSRPWAGMAAALSLGVVVVGGAALFTSSTTSWWPGPPYRVQVIQAGGTPQTDLDRLSADVARAIGTAPTVMAQSDRILNWNGLRWQSGDKAIVTVSGQGPGDTAQALGKLPQATQLITGRSPQTFEPSMDQAAVIRVARAIGFESVHTWNVSPGVDVVLWRRPAGAISRGEGRRRH